MLVVLSFADKTFQYMFEFRKAGLCAGFFDMKNAILMGFNQAGFVDCDAAV